MKKHFYSASLWAFLSLALLVSGCSDDDGYPDVDGQDPTVALTSDHIQTAAGRTITIEGTVNDADGISKIKLECADLYLKKTIDLIDIYDEPLTTYELKYNFEINRNEIGERFMIKVTVTDVGGRSTSYDVLVTMDGDFEAPRFTVTPDKTVTVLIKPETKFNLSFTVTDDRALDYVTIDIPGIDGFSARRVEANGQTTFQFAETIVLPNEVADYNVTLTAVDEKENETVATSVISVSEMPDFQKMYLADVATVAELNSDVFGVPMLIERTDAYEYKANYYNQRAGTEIFFLPQKSDFAPICFGLDPDDNTRLTDDPDVAEPIVLTEANVYYEISFNVQSGAYTISTYTVSQATNRLPQPIGSPYYLNPAEPEFIVPFRIGVLGNLPGCNGGPGEILVFTQDVNNPHLFYSADVTLEADFKTNFIIHNKHDWGWWDYCLWRVDNEDDPEKFIYGGADANPKPADVWGKPVVSRYGTYKFWFDAHLERGKLVPTN